MIGNWIESIGVLIVYTVGFLWFICLLFGGPSIFIVIGLPFAILAFMALFCIFTTFMFDSWKNFFMVVIILMMFLS